MKHVTKLFQTAIKSINQDDRTVQFCFSDDQVDRMGEIVDQATWDTKSYLSNPLILWGHDPSEPENVLGKAVDLSTNSGGKSFVTAQFDDDSVNPKAGLVFRQLLAGTLKCVSAGFIPHTIDTEQDTPVLKDNELLEISIVPIPANPRAIALAYKEGSISRKDAEWLTKSMSAEIKHLEAEMKAQEANEQKEKQMTDETAQALVESVKALTEKVDGFATDLTEFKTATEEKFTDLSEEVKKAVATDEETKTDDQVTEEDETTKEENADDGKSTDDSAKDGSDDQSGAEEGDDFDENAELTPELQAEIDAALAEEQDAA